MDETNQPMTLDELIEMNPAAACACFNLRKAARAITQLFDASYRDLGLKTTQLSVLSVLSGAGQSTINQLADMLMVDRTTLSRNLGPLEKKKLIVVSPGKDQRTRELSLTKAGQKLVDRSKPKWEQIQRRVVEGLGEERFRRMLQDLDETVRLAKDEA